MKKEKVLAIGSKLLIRTVTHYYTGKVVSYDSGEIVLSDAAWIPDTGRFSEALESGIFKEIEAYPGSVVINRGAIVDYTKWLHDLPRDSK